MDNVAVAFWGAFFGTAGLMFAGSLAAFARSQRRVALIAALSSIISALFVIAYLGWLPIGGPDAQARLLAHVAMLAAVVLALMLLAMLGRLRRREAAAPAYAILVGVGLLATALGWLLEAVQALALSSIIAFVIGSAMLAIALRSALRGDRLAWAAVSGVSFMLVAVAGLSWIALDRDVGWPVHAASAVAGMAYLAVMAAALWSRYSYLLELAEVMAQGPAYDPVTRMRSHSETGQMLGDEFLRGRHHDARVGIIVISIANLYALENLHGRSAFNYALYRCASRLRRGVPADVAMGRLADDGFLLLVRDAHDPERLVAIARSVRERLVQPIVLESSRAPGEGDARRAEWQAEVGIGVLSAMPQSRPAQAVATVRAMSRTAWTYASRMAWYDAAASQIAELPVTDTA